MDTELALSVAVYEYADPGNEECSFNVNDRAKKRWISLLEYGIETKEFGEVDTDQISDMIFKLSHCISFSLEYDYMQEVFIYG